MTIPEYPITREEMYLDAIAKGGGGGSVSHITTIDYTPDVNTQALSIPLQLSGDPMFVYIYLNPGDVPNAPTVNVVKSIRLANDNASKNSGTINIGNIGSRKTFDVTAGGGDDYWSSTPEGTMSITSLDISVANKSLFFLAGLTYHLIVVEAET